MTETAIGAADLAHAFDAMLGEIQPKILENFASSKKLLTRGGYRSGANPALLRALVSNALRNSLMSYEPTLAAFLREHVADVRLLTMLSREVLAERRRQWMGCFGKARVILALLCDPREDVRAEAAAWAGVSGDELPDADAAQAALSRLFGPAFRSGEAVVSARDRERIAELTDKIHALERAASAVRREQDRAGQKVLADVRAELATAKYNIAERDRRITALEQRLDREERIREIRVRQDLASAQVNLFRGWLEPALRAENALADVTASADLCERAEAALAAQLKADRAASGNASLRKRLEAAEVLMSRVDAALGAALVPQRALKQVRSELEAECRRLRAALGETDLSPAATMLETRIQTARTEDEYELLGETTDKLERLALLTGDEARMLRRLMARRMSLWDTFACDSEGKDEEPDPASAAIRRRNPELTAALRGTMPLFLFLDGHNILNGLGRYKLRRGTAKTHEDARKMLERDIRTLLETLPMVYAHLVWDGPTMSRYTISDNVEGFYSGGEGEHRADRFILEQMRYCAAHDAIAMVLVTDDMGFAGEAMRLGAKGCRLHDFGAFLNGPAR